uniref:CDV3 homolog n=1 Tax=Latimeria chalumnae TaxID=7897 RepID=H3AF88_LATCH
MAEPEGKSLDDFFAKRDKKRKKEKSKTAAATAIGGVLGGGGPEKEQEGEREGKGGGRERSRHAAGKGDPIEKLKRRSQNAWGGVDTKVHISQEDEEWKEFEQKEVDYSGLRIQSLQISGEKEEEENEKKEEKGEDGEDSSSGGGDRSVGPWNKSAPAPAPTDIVTEPVESKPSGVYRPPAARMSGVRRGTPQGPPEIFSDAQFPSLQSTAKQIETRKDKEMEKTFETVKHRNRARDDGSKNQSLQLELDNQYAVLGEQ